MDVQASPAGGGLMLQCRSCHAHTRVPLEFTMFDAVNVFLARHRVCLAAAGAGPLPPHPRLPTGLPRPLAS